MEKFNNREAYDALLRDGRGDSRLWAVRVQRPLQVQGAVSGTVAAEAVRNGYQGRRVPVSRQEFAAPVSSTSSRPGGRPMMSTSGSGSTSSRTTSALCTRPSPGRITSSTSLRPTATSRTGRSCFQFSVVGTVAAAVGARYETRELTLLLNTADSSWGRRRVQAVID